MSIENAKKFLDRVNSQKSTHASSTRTRERKAMDFLSSRGRGLPALKLQELPELTAAPSQYATWTGKKGGVDARGIDLEAGAADLEMRGQSLDVLNDYLEAAGVNLDRLERRASLTGAAEDVSAYESAFETYKAAAERARGEAANYDRLAGIYNEEARLQGMTTADMRAQIQENVRRLEKEADPEKIRDLQRSNENMRRRMEEIESQPTVEERLEEAYAREDELKKQVAAAERGLRRSGDVTELRRLQGDLEYVQNQITELGGKPGASSVLGAVQQYFGSMAGGAGIGLMGEDRRMQEATEKEAVVTLTDALEAAILSGNTEEEKRLRGIVDELNKPGADREALLREFSTGAPELSEEVQQRNAAADLGRQELGEDLYKWGSETSHKGAENIEAAKGGRSEAGKVLVDLGVQGLNMALDAGIGMATGGAGVPMFVRGYGSAAMEAMENGATQEEAQLYGIASAGVEVLSEKLFDGLAGVYGAGKADDVVDNIIGRMAKTETGRKAWKLLFSGAGEGLEEVLSDVGGAFTDLIYKDSSLAENFSELEVSEIAYDFMIGSIMGFFGGGVETVGNKADPSVKFFSDAKAEGMSFRQALWAYKQTNAMDRYNDRAATESGVERGRAMDNLDRAAAEAERAAAEAESRKRRETEAQQAREAERSYFEKLTTRSQANKIVNDETLKAEWQQKTGVALEGAKGDQARTVMAESQKRLDAMNAETATVSKTEEVGETNAEKVVVAENATTTEAAETAREAPQTQTAAEMPAQRKAPTAARTAQEGRNDAQTAEQTIEILRGRDTDTAQYGGVEYSVNYDSAEDSFTARAMRDGETLWVKHGMKSRTEAVNALRDAQSSGKIPGSVTTQNAPTQPVTAGESAIQEAEASGKDVKNGELHYDESKREADQRAGEQSAGGGAVSQRARAEERRAAAETGRELKSGEVSFQHEYTGDDAEIRAARESLSAAGAKNIYIYTGACTYKGEAKDITGYVDSEGNVYLRGDDPDFTLEELAAHERFHLLARQDPELMKEAEAALQAIFSAEELESIKESYRGVYRAMYGNDGLDSRIMQEIAADAFAGRGGSFRQGTQRATERVREIVTKRKAETDNDRLVQQIADAVVQKLGLGQFAIGGQSFDEDKYFARQIDHWEELREGTKIKVGNIQNGSALQRVGLPQGGMYFDVSKINKAMSDHHDHLQPDIMKRIPDMLNDPIVITEYKGEKGDVKNTVNVYGELFINEKTPVVVAVVMRFDRSGNNVITNIRTVHARSNFAKQITDESVLYLNEDKKRTRKWFQVCGNLNVPLEGTTFGLIRTIPQPTREVNSEEAGSMSAEGRMTADELTQQIAGQMPRKPRPETGAKTSGLSVEEIQRRDAERIRLRSEQATRQMSRSAFEGTDEMQAAGIKVSGSLVPRWDNIRQLAERNKAEKSIEREYRAMLKQYNLQPSSAEVTFARGLANGTYTVEDIPRRFDAGIIRDIANMEAVRSRMKLETLREVRQGINRREYEKSAQLFADSEKYNSTPYGKKISKTVMNERTPERVLRSIYGAEQGAKIFNYLFRPVYENNAEAIRFANREKSDVSRRIVDSQGKQREMTDREKAYAQHIREGEGFQYRAAQLQGYDLKTYDAYMQNFRELREMMGQDGYEDAITLTQEVMAGNMKRSEAERAAQNTELFKKVLENRLAESRLPAMERDLQEIVEGNQWFEQIRAEIEADDEMDAAIIDNAAQVIGEKYDQYYKIINQFLVAHGYDEIGFIPGYAPHMQPEPQRKALGKALEALGIQLDDVSTLPAAIAGRTADFKPNMRWNPHFQHRVGKETEYNIIKGYESYLKFMGDVIYHTDDIMRLRQAVNYFRTAYGSEEISANLSAANAIRNASLEDKVQFISSMPNSGYVPGMTMAEVNELIDSYVEGQYASVENLSKYSEFVTWLENYANMLAGKQSLADRGLEYSGGRSMLGLARTVMNAFAQSNVAASMSSVLNQTAQLPMIATHLGPKYGMQALSDIATGEVKKADWSSRSDFLTGKEGMDRLERSGWDKFMDKLFTPAQITDRLISTMAVRGEYLRQIDQGVSEEIALRRADDYARKVMGSRLKGEKPQGFESKRLFAQMVHVFQVEASNQFDYVASDMPQAIRDLVEREGKAAAAKKVATTVAAYLVQAFLLNRMGEDLYGGTPVPFDLLGLAAEFGAAGSGLTTAEWLLRLVGLSDEEGNEEFDWAAAIDAAGYTISSDLPYLRNLAGIAGVGDESLPTLGYNKAWQGAKDVWSGLQGDDERFGGGDADWRQVGRGALDVAAQIAPGGRQLKKTITGGVTVAQGGSYSGTGDNKKLRYTVEQTVPKALQALLFGPSALRETDEYYAHAEKNLTANQTFVYEALRADGMSGKDAYQAMLDYRELAADKTLSDLERANGKRDFITKLPVSDEVKLEAWLDLVHSGNETGKYETAQKLMDMGVKWRDIAAAMNAQAEIDAGDGKAGAKATAFAKWVDDYADRVKLDEGAAAIMKDELAFWSMVKQEAGTYEELRGAGLDSTKAQGIYDLWANLKPEEGKKTVSEVQKMYALGSASYLSDEERYAATGKALLDDTTMTTESGNPNQYAKMLWCQEAGLSYADYAEAKNAGAIDNLYKFGTDCGADAESAYAMAMEVAGLEKLPGADSVSNGQKYEAIGRADVEDVYKMAVMEEWLSESAFKRMQQAMGYGLTIEMYGKALQIVPKFDHNNNGSPSHAEYEAAIRSMEGLSNRERAALWQMLANGKNNPFDREVSKAMYKK